LANSGNPKSAVVKTIDLPAIQPAPAGLSTRKNLLCQAFRSPIDVSFYTADPRISAVWRPSRLLWEQNRPLDAIAWLIESLGRNDLSANIRIPTLFLLAQMHIENSDPISAERCIQRGLRDLGQQTQSHSNVRDANRSNNSTNGGTQPYAISGREWLTLAIQSLTKGDLESCLRWIFQANRELACSATTSESQAEIKLTGDLNAVLACAMTQTRDFEEAERCLVTAYRLHLDTEAFESACRDLILTSRLAAGQGQLKRASSLLDVAECQLILTLPQDYAASNWLTDTIYRDRYSEWAVR